jgi:uncharacterized membrane protein YdjX (TVP38/TMEM64 family)
MICWIIAAAVIGAIVGAAAMFWLFRDAKIPPPW